MKRNLHFKLLISVLVLVSLIFLTSCTTDFTLLEAYKTAKDNGFKGTQAEWLESLTRGKTAYEVAVEKGFTGTEQEWLDQLQGEYDKTAATAILSVVSIQCTFTEVTTNFRGQTTETETYSAGSGVIYSLDDNGNALIITNYHVVYNNLEKNANKIAEKISLYIYGREYANYAIEGVYVGGSMTYDIALLKVVNSSALKTSDAKSAKIGNTLAVGEDVLAIGNAGGEGISVTVGVVSVTSEVISLSALDNASNNMDYRVIRIDAAVNAGNSGGGLFNGRGELIGIVNAKKVDTRTESFDNIGYAIPVNVAVGVVTNLIKNGGPTVQKCMLNVTVQINSSKAIYDEVNKSIHIEETVRVSEVKAAPALGYLEEGDIFVGAFLHDENVYYRLTQRDMLSEILLRAKVGDIITLTLIRSGEEITRTFELTYSEAIK